MKTIKENVTAQVIEKKSKFMANLFYVGSIEEAESKILEVRKKYHDARHHCFAYRIYQKSGMIEKASDDGEPSGTAGTPMLTLLKKQELVNCLVIVTRYFGGILLGTGGLVRAYTQATKQAIEKSSIVREEPGMEVKVMLPYQSFEVFKHYCQINQITILETEFSEMIYCTIEISFDEKEKILYEMEKKQINIQNMEIIKEKNIKKVIEAKR